MTVLVLTARLVGEALAELGDGELMIMIDPSADVLEELRLRYPDPRITWLIGDGVVVPLPDASVDRVLGEGDGAEIARVLRP